MAFICVSKVRLLAHYAPTQRAKTALFARGRRGDIRKMAASHFSN
jgi:hypothetical protein